MKRTEQDVDWHEGRDQWWHDLVDGQSTEHEAQPFDAEHPLYIMYTSGTTAKPKGILHTSGGYLTQVSFTHWGTFDLKADTDVFWCAADVAWVPATLHRLRPALQRRHVGHVRGHPGPRTAAAGGRSSSSTRSPSSTRRRPSSARS